MEPSIQSVIEQHLGFFLFALFLSLATIFIAWYKNFFKWPTFDRKELKVTLFHVCVLFLIYFGISIVIPFVLVQIIKTLPLAVRQRWSLEQGLVWAWLNLISVSILFISFSFYLSKLSKETRMTVLGPGSYHGLTHNIKNFFMGMVTFVVSFPIVLAVSQAFTVIILYFNLERQEQVAVRLIRSTQENPFLFLLTSLFVIFIIPTIEELLFRGFLQNWFARFIGRVGALISTALIFSLFHFSISQKWGNLELLPSLFTLALFLSFIYFRQKSIVASIGLHATFNAVNILMISLSA